MTEPERLLTITELSLARTGDARLELDRVSLAVDEHETVVILGEDRSGKDALMRALCGALEGEERIGGSVLFGAPDERPRIGSAAVRVVYLPGPSSKPLSPHASAISQLARVIARKLGAPHGSGRAEFEQEISKLDGAPAIVSFEKRAGELSPEILAWGLLAAAMAQTPDLLLIDHLFEGIAPQAARPLEKALLAAKVRLNCALVCATMMTETAVRLGGRLVVLRGGRIVEEGPVARLATAQAHAYTQTLFKDVVPRLMPTRRRCSRTWCRANAIRSAASPSCRRFTSACVPTTTPATRSISNCAAAPRWRSWVKTVRAAAISCVASSAWSGSTRDASSSTPWTSASFRRR
jgi:ABC-type glutathione transport system ATPase component